jgi:hypothetical protein
MQWTGGWTKPLELSTPHPCRYTEWRMSEILGRHDDYLHSEERAADVLRKHERD